MANDGKIYITISDRRFGRNKAEADEQNKLDKQKDEKNPVADYTKQQFYNLVKQQAQQAVSYGISNIGNFTGDYVNQAHASDCMQVISMMGDLVTSFLGGMAATGGNPIGGLVAIGISVTGKAITSVEQQYAGYVENVRQNRSISQLRERAGLNGANNGSRGTEY